MRASIFERPPAYLRGMHATLTVFRFPRLGWLFGFWAMALFRIPLAMNRRFLFSRLMGSGLNGTFDIRPDLAQWAVMCFHREPPDVEGMRTDSDGWRKGYYGSFITAYWRLFRCETWTIALEVVSGHGTWDGLALGDALPARNRSAEDRPIAVLTRATIRLTRLRHFWSNVPPVSREFFATEGVRLSLGIGEAPLFRQATFSLWESESRMRDFAYRSIAHRDVVSRTRKERWYTEEMFLRFHPMQSIGTFKGRRIAAS
jgi:hypothetical protein